MVGCFVFGILSSDHYTSLIGLPVGLTCIPADRPYGLYASRYDILPMDAMFIPVDKFFMAAAKCHAFFFSCMKEYLPRVVGTNFYTAGAILSPWVPFFTTEIELFEMKNNHK